MARNYKLMGHRGATNGWKNKTPEERSAEMSRRRRLGYERQQAKLKAIREGIN